MKSPIHFASRCLSETKVAYAQIEKEMLAISFACTKFHSLIYGQKIKIYTDYQPLVSIMKKDIHKIPNNRLKRLRLKLLIYEIELQYLPGRYMYVADLLSRNFIKRNNTGEESLTDVIHTVCDIELAYKNSKEQEFIQKTQDDEVLGRVLVYCKSGWPKTINEDVNIIGS
jgi:hypothetical protein